MSLALTMTLAALVFVLTMKWLNISYPKFTQKTKKRFRSLQTFSFMALSAYLILVVKKQNPQMVSTMDTAAVGVWWAYVVLFTFNKVTWLTSKVWSKLTSKKDTPDKNTEAKWKDSDTVSETNQDDDDTTTTAA